MTKLRFLRLEEGYDEYEHTDIYQCSCGGEIHDTYDLTPGFKFFEIIPCKKCGNKVIDNEKKRCDIKKKY
jgi:hypothetical protein